MTNILEKFKNELASKIYNGEICSVYFNRNVFSEALSDFWYEGNVLVFVYHNLQVFLSISTGNVEGHFTYKDEDGNLITTDLDDSTEIADLLHEIGCYKDKEIDRDFGGITNVFKEGKKVNLSFSEEPYTKIEIFDFEKNNFIGSYKITTLEKTLFEGLDSLINCVKEIADARLNENYQHKENGNSYDFLEYLEYEKYCKDWCKEHNYPYEDLPEAFDNNGFNGECPAFFEEWHELDNDFCKNEHYSIEGMFKAFGISKVFDDDEKFTKEALAVYDSVADKFFDGIIDNLDELCESENCF